MPHGITAMLKVSLILLAGFLCLLVATTVPASNAYWEAVGPRFDRMLNPCNYKSCE